MLPKIYIFCQTGEISPNLVTLVQMPKWFVQLNEFKKWPILETVLKETWTGREKFVLILESTY